MKYFGKCENKIIADGVQRKRVRHTYACRIFLLPWMQYKNSTFCHRYEIRFNPKPTFFGYGSFFHVSVLTFRFTRNDYIPPCASLPPSRRDDLGSIFDNNNIIHFTQLTFSGALPAIICFYRFYRISNTSFPVHRHTVRFNNQYSIRREYLTGTM